MLLLLRHMVNKDKYHRQCSILISNNRNNSNNSNNHQHNHHMDNNINMVVMFLHINTNYHHKLVMDNNQHMVQLLLLMVEFVVAVAQYHAEVMIRSSLSLH
mmetsp:Transcript_49407/g.118883  ORF Transcript_49407/g.118883 Transcript_49407/m.118883 type:complete len:101 (-) Transcript_49407:1194-1496(-)